MSCDLPRLDAVKRATAEFRRNLVDAQSLEGVGRDICQVWMEFVCAVGPPDGVEPFVQRLRCGGFFTAQLDWTRYKSLEMAVTTVDGEWLAWLTRGYRSFDGFPRPRPQTCDSLQNDADKFARRRQAYVTGSGILGSSARMGNRDWV